MKSLLDKHTINWLVKQKLLLPNVEVPSDIQSEIISGILTGIPVPIIGLKQEKGGYLTLNGVEYITTILKTIKNGSLADEEKEALFEKELISFIIVDCTDEELALYHKLNNTPVAKSKKEVAVKDELVLTGIDKRLESFLTHNFFKAVNISAISSDILVQFLMVCEGGSPSDLSAKKISEFKNNLKKIPKELQETLNYLAKAFGEEKITYLRKAHLPMIYVCAKTCISNKVKADKFRKIIDNFFVLDNPEYKKAGDSHTSSRGNVNTRMTIMLKYVKENI